MTKTASPAITVTDLACELDMLQTDLALLVEEQIVLFGEDWAIAGTETVRFKGRITEVRTVITGECADNLRACY